MATRRHQSRAYAIQFLYQQDAQGRLAEELPQALKLFWDMHPPKETDACRLFTEELVRGAVEKMETIDEKIKTYSQNWDFHRITVVDRNILRLAIYELLFRTDIPPVVSINEAIELAKQFSGEESSAFVNGILDRVKLELSRPLRTAAAK
ncbi:MAG: transcription antitermination factor NusB [Verrucomicrobiae bacterium]|nr:transcription antitermination factor NusB [Verrucomicrobiae bacterium]